MDVEGQLSATRAALRETETRAARDFTREIESRLSELEGVLRSTRAQLADAENSLAKEFQVQLEVCAQRLEFWFEFEKQDGPLARL